MDCSMWDQGESAGTVSLNRVPFAQGRCQWTEVHAPRSQREERPWWTIPPCCSANGAWTLRAVSHASVHAASAQQLLVPNFPNFRSCLANELAKAAGKHAPLTWYSIPGNCGAVLVLRCLNAEPASLHTESRSRSKAEKRELCWNVTEKYSILLRHSTTVTSQDVVPKYRRLASCTSWW